MFDVDWSELFVPSGSLAEIAIRGTIVYLLLFLTMRLLPRRELGGLGASDILVLMIIADAVQNAMAGGYESITEGVLLAGVIFFWATFIDWLDFRFPGLHLGEAGPLPVIRDGHLLRRNMKREHLTDDEVLAELRKHGHQSPREIRLAFVEGDGHISFLPYRRSAEQGANADRNPAVR